MTKYAKLIIDDETYTLPVVEGTEGEKAIDITDLRKQSGFITLDPGFANTGSCLSAITFMNGEKGVLRYRGIPIEQLAANSTFIETAYLLINGVLPTRSQLNRVSVLLNDNSLIHEDMQFFFPEFPASLSPHGDSRFYGDGLEKLLSGASYHPGGDQYYRNAPAVQIRTLAAMSYKISRGHKVVYPRPDLCYCANFLNMMFDNPVKPFEVDQEIVDALNVFWILHADHEQNCSTSTVRIVGSSRSNLYAAISAGIAALWGPLHGGANQAVIEMLLRLSENGGNVSAIVEKAKDRNDPFRLMGFGHRVYRTYDPRAKIMKNICDRILAKLKIEDPLLDLAKVPGSGCLKGRLFYREQFISERRFLQRDIFAGHRHPDQHVSP